MKDELTEVLLSENREWVKSFEKESEEIRSKSPKIKLDVIGKVYEETRKANPVLL